MNKKNKLEFRIQERRKDSFQKQVKCGVSSPWKKRQNTMKWQTSTRLSIKNTKQKQSSSNLKMVIQLRIRLMKNSKGVSDTSISKVNTHSVGKFMQLPMSRIRTIINLDEDSQMVSKEALVLITKATELFV